MQSLGMRSVEELGLRAQGGRGESELLLTDGRPSLEILRLLGLSRLGELGAGSCWKKCTEKKKVPQRCFRYGPGAGFHLNMPCQLGVRLMLPPKSRPPKMPHPTACPATRPAQLLQVATPPPQNKWGLGDRSSTSPITRPRYPTPAGDKLGCVPYRLRYCLFVPLAGLSLCNPRLVACMYPRTLMPIRLSGRQLCTADMLPRFRKVPGVPACAAACHCKGLVPHTQYPSCPWHQRLDAAAYGQSHPDLTRASIQTSCPE